MRGCPSTQTQAKNAQKLSQILQPVRFRTIMIAKDTLVALLGKKVSS